MANLSVTISDIKSYSNFRRSLDLTNGVHTTVFTAEDKRVYTSAVYCSYPARVCMYRLSVSSGSLPNVAVGLENQLVASNLRNATCGVSYIRLNGVTQLGPPRGMEYDVIARLSTGPLGMPISSCSTTQPGTMVVTGSAYGPDEPLNTFSIVIGAETDYDQTKCNPASKYSCRGDPPGPINDKITASASTRLESKVLVAHQADYSALMNAFSITLNDPWAKSQYPSESLELFQLLDRYRTTANLPLKKRSTDQQRSKAEAWRPIEQNQDAATAVTSATHFPGFQFPTEVPSGFNPNSQIPWSTEGTVLMTDYNQGVGKAPRTLTITLTRTTPSVILPLQTQASRTTQKTGAVSWSSTPGIILPSRSAQAVPTSYYTPGIIVPIPSRSAPAQTKNPSGKEDAQEAADGGSYVELLLFNYARHLFISSSRQNSLPPNLAGVWTNGLQTAWSGDYHTNINLQMNHWFANQVGMGDLQQALWRFMKDTWVC
jgi:hypothetical protein